MTNIDQEVSELKNQIIQLLEELSNQTSIDSEIGQGLILDTFQQIKSTLEDSLNTFIGAFNEPTTTYLSPEDLEEMAAVASALDQSGNTDLIKHASVLDEILLTIGADRKAMTATRQAYELEIARLKSLAKEKPDPYTMAKIEHDKQNNAAEAIKAVQSIKEYRPLEAPLSTRSCPDHPGALLARIAESTYQCSLDKGIYNFENGYTTLKGNKVPGGSVSNKNTTESSNELTSFDTRESKLNSKTR